MSNYQFRILVSLLFKIFNLILQSMWIIVAHILKENDSANEGLSEISKLKNDFIKQIENIDYDK